MESSINMSAEDFLRWSNRPWTPEVEKYRPQGARKGRFEVRGYILDANGRRKPVGGEYKEFFDTPSGEMEMKLWAQKALTAVEEDGLKELYERIRERTDQYRWLRDEREKQQYALECLYSHAFEAWEDFTVIWA